MTLRPVNHVEALFEVYLEAVELKPAEQAQLFDRLELSPGDRRLIQELLDGTLHSTRIRAALADPEVVEAPLLEPGDITGIYRIERVIGQGGQGNVYLATHAQEAIDRPVAIKLPRWMALDAFASIRREAQTLSRLDHPAIARFLSVDRMPDGRVFLVTEYVDGRPMTDALRNTDRSGVLEAFVTVCDALGHAHDQGVTHLDIKPSNVLMDTKGAPRLLDFGLGLVLSRTHASGTALGYSLPYAAPEQLAGSASAASDTYSLGLLLLQVLTDTAKDALLDRRDELFADDSNGLRLSKHLGRDLHAVLRQACASEPDQRYASIAQFGADLRSVLHAEPVRARRWTWTYALTCLVRRRPWTAAAVAGLITLLCGTLAALALQHERLVEAEHQARTDAERARIGLSMLVSAMEAGEPEGAPEVTDAERALVDRLRRSARNTEDPRIRATSELVVARIAFSAGDSETAMTTLDEIIQLAGKHQLPDLLGDALILKVDILTELARFDEADETLALIQMMAIPDASRWRALRAEGRRLIRAGRLDEGERVLNEALSVTNDDFPRISLINHLGTVLNDRGRAAEALELFESQHPLIIAAYGDGTVALGVNWHNRAVSLFALGDIEPATQAARTAQTIYQAKLGPHSLRLADALVLEAIILNDSLTARARVCLDQAVTIYRHFYGNEHPKIAQVQYTLAHVMLSEGDADEALKMLHEAMGIARTRLPEQHPLIGALNQGIGEALVELGRPQEALAPLMASLDTFEQINPSPDITKAILNRDLSRAYRALGRLAESADASRYAYDVATELLPESSLERALYGLERAASLASSGALSEARPLFEANKAIIEQHLHSAANGKSQRQMDHVAALFR